MDKQHLRDLLEIQTTIDSRMKFLATTGFPVEEQKYRKEELNMLLNKVKKIRSIRKTPIESIETVRGTSFKIGDKFHIAGDLISTYTIVLFPDTVTIRGEASNPAIGKPWTCEVYLESAIKVKKEKSKRIKKVDGVGGYSILIKEGDYFATRTNNTIYKVTGVKKKKVKGANELKAKNAPKAIEALKSEIILKTKKEYKKQHKAERKYKE